jgi:hypothetical protein
MKREKILKYIGNQLQLGGTRHYILSDGWGRNMRCIDIDSGSGLKYTVMPDRGMDISLASFKGINLVYLSCNAETHPAFYEPEKLGWLHTFNGGLLTTCGLTYLGPPVNDDGEELGLHGRYSTIPARQVNDLSQWVGDEYHIKIKGTAEEGCIFGNKLRVERELSTVVGTNTIILTDTITNFGYKSSPFTLLYHMNIGYPMLSEDAELFVDPALTSPRDEDAKTGMADFRHFSVPMANYREQVFFHRMKTGKDGMANVELKNKTLGISLSVNFDTAIMPYLVQWKMMGQGDYVLGLEPANVPVKDRKALKEEKLLPYLHAGESVTNKISIILEDLSAHS